MSGFRFTEFRGLGFRVWGLGLKLRGVGFRFYRIGEAWHSVFFSSAFFEFSLWVCTDLIGLL